VPALVDLTETQILGAVRSLLLAIVPPGVECIRAQVNKVPEPIGPDFLIMTPMRRERLSTNVDNDSDILLTGSIADTTLTVTAVKNGALVPGMTVTSPTVAPGTTIVAVLSGTGGVGTYTVNPSQQVPSGPLYAGLHAMLVATEYCLQIDVHGPNSGDTAQMITTLARDAITVQAIERQGVSNLQTLYASDPRQMAFLNAESQYEDRWMIEWHLQANITTSVFQDFADELHADITNVEAELLSA
jgi:hypothetical protein